MTLDKIDLQIISELEKDGRISFKILAKQLGISNSSVSRRVRKLLSDNIMKIVAVHPDPEKTGHQTMAIIGLNVESNRIEEICKKLVSIENIVFAGVSYGRFNIIISVYINSQESLHALIKSKLYNLSYIHNIETFYIAEVKKRTPLAPPSMVKFY